MNFTEENQIQNTRLRSILGRLQSGEWNKNLGADWTVGTMICHLAFWDRMTSVRLRLRLKNGSFAGVPDGDTVEALNDTVRLMSASIDQAAGSKLATDAADEIDSITAALSPEQIQELLATGRERWLRRHLHRQTHLDRIEKALAEK